MDASSSADTTSKKLSFPPDAYTCKLCQVKGHWIQQCPEKKKHKNNNNNKNNKKKKTNNPNHVHRPGVDPSADDIERARNLQKLKPPMCFCRIQSRLKKVKRSFATYGGTSQKNGLGNNNNSNNNNNNSNNNGDSNYYGNGSNNNSNPNEGGYVEPDYEISRAIGNYFFFCMKKKTDTTKCRFARPVEDHDEVTPRASRICTFFQKTGSCQKGDACAFSHELVVVPEGEAASKRKRNGEEDHDDKKDTKNSETKKLKGDDGDNYSSSSSSDKNDNQSKSQTTTTTISTTSSPVNSNRDSSSDSDSVSEDDATKPATTNTSTKAETKDNSSDSSSGSDSDSDSKGDT